MAKETSKYVKVVLSGEGSDELFGGYPKYKIFKLKKYLPSQITTPHTRLNSFLKKNYLESYLEFMSVFDTKERKLLYKHYKEINFIKNIPKKRILEFIFKNDVKNWLPNDLLLKVDKMTMAHSLEARVPFLDHKLVEFAFSIPENQKLRFFKDKYIYRETIKNKIPKEIYKRKKQGFTIPLHSWIKKGIKEYALDLINKNNIKFLNKKFQIRIINNPTKTIFTKRQFWTILMFHQWYKEYSNKITMP
jgi:asparagine synthase (glutamine-hydrolysing)